MDAYGYIRCSGIGQLDGDGPQRQRDAIEAFAQAHDATILKWFVESHTGTDLEGRPEFQKMRQELAANGTRMVIVERIDRLARDILIQEMVLADFRKNGIELKSATPCEDDLCGTDPTRTLVRQILGCFAQYERSMIILKLNAGRARKRANGGHAEGPPRFGNKPGEAETYDRIISGAKAGLTAETIADSLNDRGLFSRSGKPWKPQTINKIIRRWRYEECENESRKSVSP